MDQQQEARAETRPKSIEHGAVELEKHVVKVGSNNYLAPDIENRGAIKGDDSDGRVNWTPKRVLATLFLSGLYVGSQLPLFFVGGSLAFMAKDIGGATIQAWMPISYSLALAAIAPFCGYLQDIFGRRNITLAGGIVLCVGIIVVATAHSIGAAIGGMAIAGAGAAVGELTALAGTSELVPVSKRGLYLAFVTFFVLPFCPWPMYTQLLGHHSTWRWGLWICLIYNGMAVAGIAVFYFPESNLRSNGKSTRSILANIDYIGAALSVTGLTLLLVVPTAPMFRVPLTAYSLVGLTAGGFTHPWASVYVLCTLLVGLALIFAFIGWEWKGAKVPMIPKELFAGQPIVGIAFLIAFVAGMYYYSLINFFPIVYASVYNPDPVQVGLKGIAPGLSVTFGAVGVNALLSLWKGHNRELLIVSAIMMTAFGGALATTTPDNPKTTVALGTLAGFGVGGVLVPAATIAITVCPDSLIATCVALSLSIRVIGGSIGYAIYYNIFISKMTANLPAYVGLYAVKAGLPLSSAETFVGLYLTAPQKLSSTPIPGLTAAIVQAAGVGSSWAYAESLKYVWYTSIAFGGLSIVASMFLGDISKYMTNRIAADIRR